MRRISALAVAGIATLAFASNAQAHFVLSATADCDSASVSIKDFGPTDTNINVAVNEGSTTLASQSVATPAGTQTVTLSYPALSAGRHNLVVKTTWLHGKNPKTDVKTVHIEGCEGQTPTPETPTTPTTPTTPQQPVAPQTQTPAPAPAPVATPAPKTTTTTGKRRVVRCLHKRSKRTGKFVIVKGTCGKNGPLPQPRRKRPAVKGEREVGSVVTPHFTG